MLSLILISTTLHLNPFFLNLAATLSARLYNTIFTSSSVSKSLGVIVPLPIDFIGADVFSFFTGDSSYPFAKLHRIAPILPNTSVIQSISVLAKSPIVWIPYFCILLLFARPTYNKSDIGSFHAFVLNSFLYIVVLDINGWDLKKVLKQIHKSNATVFEWANSPVVYYTTSMWKEYITLQNHIFLACKWIEERKCPPPVLFNDLKPFLHSIYHISFLKSIQQLFLSYKYI